MCVYVCVCVSCVYVCIAMTCICSTYSIGAHLYTHMRDRCIVHVQFHVCDSHECVCVRACVCACVPVCVHARMLPYALDPQNCVGRGRGGGRFAWYCTCARHRASLQAKLPILFTSAPPNRPRSCHRPPRTHAEHWFCPHSPCVC